MIVIFYKSFLKSIDKLRNPTAKKTIVELIVSLEQAKTIKEVLNMKKMEGFKNYYRIRMGDYKVGFELENSTTIRIIIVAHRKDIYKVFP